MLISLGNLKPNVHKSAFVAESAQVIGDVTLDEKSSVWFSSVIRGDSGKIIIGKRSNVQDGCILHPEIERPVLLGEGVTLGHGVVAHSCNIGSNTLIGIRSVVLDGASVGANCIIGAGSVVMEGTQIIDGTVAWGIPAKPVRKIKSDDLSLIKNAANQYVSRLSQYKSNTKC